MKKILSLFVLALTKAIKVTDRAEIIGAPALTLSSSSSIITVLGNTLLP